MLEVHGSFLTGPITFTQNLLRVFCLSHSSAARCPRTGTRRGILQLAREAAGSKPLHHSRWLHLSRFQHDTGRSQASPHWGSGIPKTAASRTADACKHPPTLAAVDVLAARDNHVPSSGPGYRNNRPHPDGFCLLYERSRPGTQEWFPPDSSNSHA